MMNCHEATRLMSEEQEQKLALKDRLPLKMHQMMCSGCRNFGHQMHTIRQIAHAYAKGENERTHKTE
jgi:hypothetical protein